MAINIKNDTVEALLNEITKAAGTKKTDTIFIALKMLKANMALQQNSEIGASEESKEKRLLNFLTRRVWSKVPKAVLGKSLSKQEEAKILGFDKHGI